MSAFKSAWHHLRRSPFQSLLALLLMFFTFFLFSSYFIVSTGMASVLSYFETKPEITIFLKDGLDKDTVAGIQKELSNFQNVREIKFISKDQALQLYKQENQNNPLLTEMVTSSVLPASFEVSVNDPQVLSQISTSFTGRKEVDEIIYQKDVINSLLSWTRTIRVGGIGFISFTSLVSFLVIFVVIGMKITQRKDEIKVSRLLGASHYYVQRPFIIEGLIYGGVGGALGIALSVGLSLYLAPKLNTYFAPITFISLDPVFYLKLVAITLASALLLGLFASLIGTRRYIKF